MRSRESIYDVDVYEPHIKCRGVIAVIHGMSPFGKDDARIVVLCKALSQAGYRVLAPDIQSIKALHISSGQIDVIADVLEVFSSNADLCPSGRVSVLAPSFSGGMCLAAAAMPNIRDKIISVCAVGAFTHVESVMAYLLTDSSADPYGMYIVLKKILPLVIKDDSVLQRALDAAIKDNLNDFSEVELTNCLSALSAEEQNRISLLLNDARYRTSLFKASKPILEGELKALNIVSRLVDLKAKVFLLHGKEDKVIPSEQSEKLYEKLKQLDVPTGLVVSPFISHGDTHISLKQVPDLVRIIKGFSFFFDDLHTLYELSDVH